jgi:two-component system phosphate regulon sensor histidine kinase PhoR
MGVTVRHGGRVAWFTALLFAVGVAAGAGAQAAGRDPGGTPWLQAPLVVGVLALASHLIVRAQWRDEVEAFDLFEAVLAPTIVVFPGLAAVALAFLAKGVVGSLHRLPPVKAAFNAAQWAAATGCGAYVFALMRGPGGLTEHNAAALAVAMVVVATVNYAAFVVVLALAGRRSLGSVLTEIKPLWLVGWAGGSAVNLAFGVLFVSAYLRSPAAIVVMVVPLFVLHWGSRGFATARTDRVRLTGLQTATHVLAGPIDPRDALPPFLAEVRRCFEADAVDLLELGASGLVRHRVTADGTYDRAAGAGASLAAHLLARAADGVVVLDERRDALLAEDGWRVVAAAPVRTGERSFGVLCVYNRGGVEGFEHGEIVVLQALAAEAAGALDKAELLEGMLEERRQLADIVGNTSDGIVTLDERGAVTSWNNGIEQITGYDAVAMAGGVPDDALRPRDAQGEPVRWSAWAESPDTLPASVEIVSADKQSRWLSCSYTVVPPRDGRGPQLVVMARDVTRSHELEKLKDDFVAVVSHELRTPLAPIKGWAVTLLKRGDELTPDQRREGSRAILRQADRLEQLILNILEDSRVESGLNTAPIDEVVDARASVAKVLDDFAVTAPERSFVLHAGSVPVPVYGRSVRLEQILSNLLANAVKYSPKHEPIDVTIERGADTVLLSVTDRGPGIPTEARERIFERFERLAESPTQTGTGLGLYISRRLAETMEGTLDVEPATGGGSTFTLALRTASAFIDLAAVS